MQAGPSLSAHLARFARGGEMRGLALQLLTATAALMIAALILMSFTLSSLMDSRRQSEAMQDTMLEVTTVEARMLDAEGALNGYAVTGSSSYQERVTNNNKLIVQALNKLRRSVQNDPPLLRTYTETLELNRQRMAILAGLDRPERRGDIGARVLSAKPLSDRIRGNIWSILETQRTEQRLNNSHMIKEARRSYWVAAGIVGLTFLFGALCLVLSMAASGRER
jgi:CHASE3 domain sensor protein